MKTKCWCCIKSYWGKIIIKGLGSYEGSEKVFEFDINPRQATDVEVPEKILFNGVNQDGKDYAIVPAVVANMQVLMVKM